MAKRDIFGELMEGVAAMKGHRQGKVTLRTHKIEASTLPSGRFETYPRHAHSLKWAWEKAPPA